MTSMSGSGMQLSCGIFDLAKLWPHVDPPERAVAAALVLGLLDDLKPADIAVTDIDGLPDWRLARRMLRSLVARLGRSATFQRHGNRAGNALMAATLKALQPDVRNALGAYPRGIRRPSAEDDPHSTVTSNATRQRAMRRALSGAERELRERIAAGELPASMLATRMRPARRRGRSQAADGAESNDA